MQAFPPCPSVADAPPALFERGHLWLHELVDSAPIRFRLAEDGRLRFADDHRTFGDDVPPAYGHVVRHVRERFDRGALRDAVDDVTSVVFFGRAMHRRGVDYDWARTPSFLGSDVWSADADRYLLPDRVEKIYRRLGLDPLETVQAELRAADFDPDAYAFPSSTWYDGPVAGVLVRNKTGLRAALSNPAVGGGSDTRRHDAADARRGDEPDAPESDTETAARSLARRHATPARFDAVAARLREENRPLTFDALFERTVEIVVRAHHDRLFTGRDDVDLRAFRSAVAERTRAYLDDRGLDERDRS
ncbi:hypothetical protein [Salinigranum salinum]|uniref:hypothetical protein n=1 Tax=Salinigranum salinum TaxID=1364937 RepID=UPI00126076F3|nr:hypothetical protein [Salinigranum salinum]